MKKHKIAIVGNYGMGLFKFRMELIEKLIEIGHDVHIIYPVDQYESKFTDVGAKVHNIDLNRHSTNPLSEIKLIIQIHKIIKKENFDKVLTYTIKPNIYLGLIRYVNKFDLITNITGVGTNFQNNNLKTKIFENLYKIGLLKSKHVFFQNEENLNQFINKKIIKNNYSVIPGSGVNLEKFKYKEYPNSKNINFLFIGRLNKDKGILELVRAVTNITNQNIKLTIVGIKEDIEIENAIKRLIKKDNRIILMDPVEDVIPFIEESHCLILPSYHEGMSNVLLETSSIGRPSLASDIPGCKEIIKDGITGYLFEKKSINSIQEKIKEFIELNHEKRKNMGLNARKHVENVFNRNIIINKYLEIIGE